MKICAVLNLYKRPAALRQQISAIRGQSIAPTEILIWKNFSDSTFDLSCLNDVTIATSNRNHGVWARFAFALNTQCDYVAIFDDDTLPGSRWFENCIKTINVYNGLLGTRGLIFQSRNSYGDFEDVGWKAPNAVTRQVDIVGHAWFFRREWLSTFWRELPELKQNLLVGEDIHFSYSLQRYLGLSTYVPPHPLSDKRMWGSLPTEGMAYGADGHGISESLYAYADFNKAFKLYIKKGFQLQLDSGQIATANPKSFREKIGLYLRQNHLVLYIWKNLPGIRALVKKIRRIKLS